MGGEAPGEQPCALRVKLAAVAPRACLCSACALPTALLPASRSPVLFFPRPRHVGSSEAAPAEVEPACWCGRRRRHQSWRSIAGDGCGDDATPAAAAAVARPPPPPRLLGDLVDVCGDWCNGAGVVDGSRDGGDARGGLADDTRGGVSGLAAGGSGAWLATPSSLLSVGSAVSVATGCSSSAASAAPSDDDGGGGDGKRKAAVAADTAAVPAGRTPSPHRRAAAPSSAPAEGRGEPPPRSHTPTPKAAKSHSLCLRACAPAERSATPQPTPLVCTPPVHSPRGGGSDGWTARHASAARRTCWQAYTLRGAVRARRWRDTAAAASAPASPTPLCGEAIVPPSPHPPRRGRSCLIDKRVKCCVHGTDCLLLRLSTW